MFKTTSRQSGVAVILSLLMVTLIATLAYVMIIRFQKDVHEAQWFDQHEREAEIAHGSVLGVMEQLRLSYRPDEQSALPIERFPIRTPESTEQGYHVLSIVYDAGGLLNVNALEDATTQKQLQCMLKILLPDWQDEKRNALVRSIREWIMQSGERTVSDSVYLKQPVPYRPRHDVMASSSELRLVYGMDGETYHRLRPFVTALPGTKKLKLNIMSAPLEVLACLNDRMTMSAASALIQMRDSKSFGGIQELTRSPLGQSFDIKADNLTTRSDFFLVRTDVWKNEKKQVFFTFLERYLDRDKPGIKIVWRSKGVY